MRPQRASDLDTIVAAATPPARSAIALVRVSGQDALAVARAVAPGLPERPQPRRAYRSRLVDSGGLGFDEAIVTFFAKPASYTGEDTAEISLHGNPVLVDTLLAAACAAGSRLASPGEFSRRAVLNGKLDLLAAEAVAELIEARTEELARAALARLEGDLAGEVAAVRGDLLESAANWSAMIDFPGEADGGRARETAAGRLGAAAKRLDALLKRSSAGARVAAGIRVVIAGRPNAGKSTIFNALLARERAIVAPHPGTTRDTVEEDVPIAGLAVRLVDTAGLRESPEPVEREGIARARREVERADLVIWIHDTTRPWDAVAQAEWNGLNSLKLLILNKIDIGERPVVDGIPLDARDSGAASVLRNEIDRCLREELRLDASSTIASGRQHDLLRRCRAEVGRAIARSRDGDAEEIALSHVEEALGLLGELAGETTNEQMLDRLFSNFCIGK